MSQELGLWIPSYEANQTQLISTNSDSSFSILHNLGIELLILPFEVLSENKTASSLSDQWDGNIVIDYGIQFLDAYNLEMQRDSLLNHYTSGMMLVTQESTLKWCGLPRARAVRTRAARGRACGRAQQ